MYRTYDEYKKNYVKTHPLSSVIGEPKGYHMQLEYLYDEIKDDIVWLRKNIDFIAGIINQILDLNNIAIESGSMFYIDYLNTMQLLVKIGHKRESMENIDQKFFKKVFSYLKSIEHEDFDKFWQENLAFLNNRYAFYKEIKIGTTETELHFQYELFQNNRKKVTSIKESDYYSFLTWAEHCYFYYENKPERCDYYYGPFIDELLTQSIVCCKNNSLFPGLSKYIIYREDFITKNESKKIKRGFRKVIRFISGYGEQPGRLLIVFAVFAILFSVAYFFMPGIEGLHGSIIHRAVGSLYMYMTTSLTIGYGDIKPITSCARIIVMLNEILGFVVGGSLISLYLRKLFRY